MSLRYKLRLFTLLLSELLPPPAHPPLASILHTGPSNQTYNLPSRQISARTLGDCGHDGQTPSPARLVAWVAGYPFYPKGLRSYSRKKVWLLCTQQRRKARNISNMMAVSVTESIDVVRWQGQKSRHCTVRVPAEPHARGSRQPADAQKGQAALLKGMPRKDFWDGGKGSVSRHLDHTEASQNA